MVIFLPVLFYLFCSVFCPKTPQKWCKSTYFVLGVSGMGRGSVGVALKVSKNIYIFFVVSVRILFFSVGRFGSDGGRFWVVFGLNTCIYEQIIHPIPILYAYDPLQTHTTPYKKKIVMNILFEKIIFCKNIFLSQIDSKVVPIARSFE